MTFVKVTLVQAAAVHEVWALKCEYIQIMQYKYIHIFLIFSYTCMHRLQQKWIWRRKKSPVVSVEDRNTDCRKDETWHSLHFHLDVTLLHRLGLRFMLC